VKNTLRLIAHNAFYGLHNQQLIMKPIKCH